jgi:Fur family transcriptional regulator, ferric uptake regulator
MSELSRFKQILKKSGCFATKPRIELFKYLQNNPEVSIKELINDLSSQDQATIYRSVKLFENLGILNRLQLGWKSKLELSNQFHDHHHHMTCINCGKVIAWEEDPTIELRIQTVAMKLGFIPHDHQLEIRGTCQTCHIT